MCSISQPSPAAISLPNGSRTNAAVSAIAPTIETPISTPTAAASAPCRCWISWIDETTLCQLSATPAPVVLFESVMGSTTLISPAPA
ncbi:hypothetical protein A4R44_06803 [Amycolatopsis sp. M39]|nr:hypothetical protein A4R44_06803 [Amycolatopsis sp. M39]